MPTYSSRGEPQVSKVVERQMRNWELARAQQLTPPTGTSRRDVADFVSLSRTVGCGGTEIAARLGQRLGWPVFDRQILQAMAGDDKLRAQLYERMDERDVSWLEDAMRWIMRGEFRQEDFVHRLTETVLALARKGPAVFLGRGVDLILPQERGLRVRLTASLEFRSQRFALLNNITAAMARDEVERIDRERADFRRHHFGPDANEQVRHDLIVVLDHFTAEQAVELIVATLRIRGVIR